MSNPKVEVKIEPILKENKNRLKGQAAAQAALEELRRRASNPVLNIK